MITQNHCATANLVTTEFWDKFPLVTTELWDKFPVIGYVQPQDDINFVN